MGFSRKSKHKPISTCAKRGLQKGTPRKAVHEAFPTTSNKCPTAFRQSLHSFFSGKGAFRAIPDKHPTNTRQSPGGPKTHLLTKAPKVGAAICHVHPVQKTLLYYVLVPGSVFTGKSRNALGEIQDVALEEAPGHPK